MEVNAIIGEVIRLGRYEEKKPRTILLKVPNAYQRRMVLLSARKLKTFSQPIFLSKQLTKEEADLENLALVRRRELINEGTDPKNLRVRDATLFIRQGAKWTKEKLVQYFVLYDAFDALETLYSILFFTRSCTVSCSL